MDNQLRSTASKKSIKFPFRDYLLVTDFLEGSERTGDNGDENIVLIKLLLSRRTAPSDEWIALTEFLALDLI